MDLEARTRRIAIRVHTSEWGSFSFFLAGKLMIRRWYNDLIEVKLPERFREKFAAYLFTELRRRYWTSTNNRARYPTSSAKGHCCPSRAP
jgi:hypothetical protein